ncbi:MAG: quinone-dependent dihydroorotate dehydrogenase [Flavobacteriales bacterium]|nr:quinone-dependent dihydroorotate dehydrogenase [Flavobacteriales bacterium]
MYGLIKFLLFFFSAERAHQFTMFTLKVLFKIPGGPWLIKTLTGIKNNSAPVEFAGLQFTNMVGLAAGFDKDAKYIDVLAALGFGYIEIGTLTPKPQSGNPRPRLFRLVKDEALINRMGFNNEGADAALFRLKKVKSNIIVGGNIGKNKTTPNELAYKDYEYCFNKLYGYVDYFVVNVSSPNTPGLRELQEKPALIKILKHLQHQRDLLISKGERSKPIFLKIAPDLTDEQLDDIIELSLQIKLDGLVATNTTVERSGLITEQSILDKIGNGGLSGKPLKNRSNEIVQYLYERLGNKVPVIGVGGIHSASDAQEKIDCGARAIQIYTGFIYSGPGLIKRILKQVKPV